MSGVAASTSFILNGEPVPGSVSSARRLLDVLRDDLGLKGTKEGCGVGECGSCAVLIDGEAALSCLVLAGEVEGRAVTTIEATADDRVEAMRRAFIEEGALQCGFCTPGMILVASRIPAGAGEEEIRAALVGNACRCSGYASIVRAIRRAHAAEGSPRGVETGDTVSVGREVPMIGSDARVTGREQYPHDLAPPDGCLHAATVRAPVACARITSIDFARALATPGVVRVLTADDVPGTNRFGLAEPDQPVLADGWIRGASDVVALVVARDRESARAGAAAVDLTLERVTPVWDPARALDETAPPVQRDRPSVDGRHPNLLAERTIARGDVEAAFDTAHAVVEATYRTGHVEHAFLATEAGLAVPSPDGTLRLHVSTQWPEADLRQAAAALGEPYEALSIVQETIGGAFGGREDISLQILLFLAARACEAPVRMVWDRAESIRGHGKRHPVTLHHRLASDAEGRFLGATADVLIDAGCYASTSRQLLDNALAQIFGPYDIGSVRAAGRAVLTNNPYACAFRGFGVNQVTFAMEQQVNRLAAALGIEPVDLRLRNLPEGPRVLATGCDIAGQGGLTRTIARAVEEAGEPPNPSSGDGLVFGRGVASAMKNCGFGFGFDDAATAEVELTGSGAIVRVGAADVGQGIETVLTQIAATALHLELEAVVVEWTDSRTCPEAGSTSASRQTMAAGNAVLEACRQLLEGGGEEDRDRPRSVRCTWRFPATTALDRGRGRPLAAFGWATAVADVAVDTRSGDVRVLRLVNAIDAGRAINPLLLRGQVEGGAVMGQGYALLEQVPLVEGLPARCGLETCAVPTAVDAVPDIRTVVIEEPEEIGPFGARGVGEATMIAVVPAITAAIHAACGVWIDEIPATPERVLAALADARG